MICTIGKGHAALLFVGPALFFGPFTVADCAGQETPPAALYLTWQNDPTTTMTIQWHTEGDTGEAMVEYGPLDSLQSDIVAASDTRPMAFSSRVVHTAEVTGLDPGSKYWFRIRNTEAGRSSPRYQFRTMPADLEEPVVAIFGGDVRTSGERMAATNRRAMEFDPEFIVWGGDLAYADGREDRVGFWYQFFDVIMDTLICEEGRVVPTLMGIGNHEVIGGYYFGRDRGSDAYEDTDEFRESIAPYYYSLIAFPGHPGYGVLDFGDYMSLIFLDSDHTNPIGGTQTDWLEETLAGRQDGRHLFPIYHVPGYPSARTKTSGGTNGRVRRFWHPRFETYGVRVAFENHDHTYKRTIPIRGGEPHEEGIVYLGDGAWGVGLRQPHDPAETWYLERAESVHHFTVGTIAADSLEFVAVAQDGTVIDEYRVDIP